MRTHTLTFCLVTASLMATTTRQVARAGLLDFETTPSGDTPVDNASLDTPYAIPGGTAFFYFDNDNNLEFDPGTDLYPFFELTGNQDPIGAFTSSLGVDVPRPAHAARLGNYFLRTNDRSAPANGQQFVVDYDVQKPIRALSGEIWDIDGTAANDYEQWRIDVLRADATVLASLDSPIGRSGANSLQAAPWLFAFTDLPDGVDKLRISFIGTRQNSIGFAFNNFSPVTAVPEPVSGVLLATGAIPVLLGRRVFQRRVG